MEGTGTEDEGDVGVDFSVREVEEAGEERGEEGFPDGSLIGGALG